MLDGHFTLQTEHGLICIQDTDLKNDAPALLLIHGNSSCSDIFKYILSDPVFLSSWRLITFDLPGHGASSDSPVPKRTYTQRGYADLAVEILSHLSISKVVVLGWSLGGHIGIEMIPLLGGLLKGLMITGTPPSLGLEQTDEGFRFKNIHMGIAAKKDLSEEEVALFARNTAGETAFAAGKGIDQRKVVEEEEGTVVAVVNGAEEPFVNLDYLDQIQWKRLWKGKCIRMEGLGHAPFWEKPKEFAGILADFMRDCEKL
ncbi:alpha/beta-hydrolase [Zopfia rhizophila CBS 207.26]|uniref:Alpha/beta-hydrolase n=1 Tax=Zopfia rhizophila CBS 207.26 TaxID=1314779 RepID=A0A6A6EQ35_9PEZI|nr:alpha/beta-hydrolase [Zopfia rhizophila CBS 207.26]